MSHPLDDSQTEEVLAFCQEHGLTQAQLDLAITRMTQTFPDAERITVVVEQDADSDWRWVVVEAVVAGAAREVRLRHQKCEDEIVRLLPYPASALIITSYSLT